MGYHGAGPVDGTAWPYESTGLGAYDGLFHDHGEAEHLHYVTNDAIVFAGNLAVMESGSSLTTYYWNIYNLMGDPSLSTFLGVPTANAVSTSGMSPSGVTVNAEPGSYVGFTEDGTLIGAGTVGTTGSVDITFTTTPSGASPLHMVVMAQNKIPYMDDLNVAAPTIVVDVASFNEELAPNGTVARNLTISNTGESGSVLVYDIGVQAENPGVKNGVAIVDKSVAGSTMVSDTDGFYAGTTLDLEFTVTNGSTDYEWLTDITLNFPAGMTVNSSTAFTGGSSPMSSNGETGDGVTVTWHGETTSGWGVIEGGESASATLNVTFDSGLAGSQDIAWSIQGDVYGSTPHSLSGTVTMTAQGPSITLTAPDGGEVLGIGTATDVTWSSAGGFTGPVMIELSRNGGSDWETIVASTTDDGSESWTVTGPSSTDCLVRVGSLDGSVRDAGNGTFTIYQPVNWLSVAPLSGSVPDGSSDVLDVDFDATGMAVGTHTAYIVIDNNTGPQPEVVPVTMVVADPSSGVDVPFNFALRGNYPNPFNPVTAIAYSIPKADNVLLQVIDVRGRVVRTLVDGQQDAGEHTVRWDGTNTAGVTVASGVYFSRLVVGDRDAVSKMTLTK